MKNEPSFYEKQHVVLWKTTRHFIENNTSFLEGILCSLGKDLKLGIRCEKLKINSYFCQTQPQDKKKYKFFHRNLWQLKKNYIFAMSIYQLSLYPLSRSYS